jgi:hypothetical protein
MTPGGNAPADADDLEAEPTATPAASTNDAFRKSRLSFILTSRLHESNQELLAFGNSS